MDDYTISEKIGEGGFGTVHLATNKESNKQFAVKFMDMTQTRKLTTKILDLRQHFVSQSLLKSLSNYVVSMVSNLWFSSVLVHSADAVNGIYKEANSI